MPWIVRLKVPAETTELMTSELWDAGTTGVAELEGFDATTLLAGFEERATADAAAATFGGLVEPVSSSDWAMSESTTVDVDGTTLTLEVGTAFGHGAHPTTRLALDGLHATATVNELGNVLDVGAGTGVLTLAAATLGATSVVGVDIDPVAVEIAGRNRDTNREQIGSAAVELIAGELTSIDGRFDTIVANMLLADLRPLAELIDERLGTTLVVSGFLIDQEAEMRQLFSTLTVVDHRHDDGWVMLRFARDHE